MTKKDLIKSGCLVPETLQEGMRLYRHSIMSGSDEELYSYLRFKIDENGMENVYLDFYYGTLSKEERQRANIVLTLQQMEYLRRLNLPDTKDDVYFPYERNLFEIAFRLSITDTLFSSFYFAKTGETVWSNYHRKFIVFSRRPFH